MKIELIEVAVPLEAINTDADIGMAVPNDILTSLNKPDDFVFVWSTAALSDTIVSAISGNPSVVDLTSS